MHPGSDVFISGFYTEDLPVLGAEAERLGLHFVHACQKDNWADVKFTL